MSPSPVRTAWTLAAAALLCFCSPASAGPSFKTPVSHEEADRRAGDLLARMTRAEKLQLISGHNSFYVRGFPHLGIPELYMADATQGVNIRRNLSHQLETSTAMPCPLALAATWDPELSERYARSVGEECRAGGIAFLLGPGVNIYRHSQNGRNFEYFGEDPYLAATLVERYVQGVLDTGTIPTLKHFVANNTDWHRRTSNSVVDDRTLREVYLPAFQAGINAGAMAVMTSYNQLNGEWCGQSEKVITRLLREEMGFRWLVMSDWWSVWDAATIIRSGLDLEMPGEKFLARDAERLLDRGEVSEAQVDRMARSILKTTIAMGFHDRPLRDDWYLRRWPEHEQVALETARKSVVLLRNKGLLPLAAKDLRGPVLLTGLFATKLARGGGAANVEGYNIVTLLEALRAVYGERLRHVEQPSDEDLRSAETVIVSTGTLDSEGWDRPFELPAHEEQRVLRAVGLNPRTVVVVNAGGGVRMTDWADKAAAVLYGWYPGQIGNRALAEVLCGAVNPSGKLPITIEREFRDSPGHGYLPPGAQHYADWGPDNDMNHPINSIEYKEGVLVGHRWYEQRGIAPLFALGHGLSYSKFEYSALRIPEPEPLAGERVSVEFTVRNAAGPDGVEIAQVYVSQVSPSVPRPPKELKGFARMTLKAGETAVGRVRLRPSDFAFWDPATRAWKVEPGEYVIRVGGASDAVVLEGRVRLRAAQ